MSTPVINVVSLTQDLIRLDTSNPPGRERVAIEHLAAVLERAEILYAMFEIDAAEMEDMIPAALNPTIPPVVMISVARYPDSRAGAFVLAQVRVGCRAGVRPRGFLLQAYSDSAAACRSLPTTWRSIGAGTPKLRIWLTMSAGRKAKEVPGNWRGSCSRMVLT